MSKFSPPPVLRDMTHTRFSNPRDGQTLVDGEKCHKLQGTAASGKEQRHAFSAGSDQYEDVANGSPEASRAKHRQSFGGVVFHAANFTLLRIS